MYEDDNNTTTESESLTTQELAVQMLQNQGVLESPNNTENLGAQEPGQQISQEGETGQQKEVRGGHPAWAEILSAIPEEYHEAITPKLREWDSGVTRRFQEIHSQYEPYKAYEPIVEQGFDVDTLSKAIGLFQAINADPRQVYDALGESYGFHREQESEYDEEEYSQQNIPPAILEQLQRQEQALEQVAEYMQQQQMSVQESQAQAELSNYLSELENTYGEFDEDYVIALMANGVDGEVAVRRFQETVGNYNSNLATNKAPKVLSSSGGGGVPANVPDPTQMSSKDTQALVVEMLRLANNEGN